MIGRGFVIALLLLGLSQHDHGFLVWADYFIAGVFVLDSLIRSCFWVGKRFEIRRRAA
jgi:hypothetical protein